MVIPGVLTEKFDVPPNMEHTRIHPGEYAFFKDAPRHIISTLLGSCVSVCLYDQIAKVIGMNHILLANPRYSRDMPIVLSEAGRYGVHAMELLINGMLKLGAQKRMLKAKVFGGANVLAGVLTGSNFAVVGDVNARFASEFLENEGIPIISSALGGERGRVIFFDGRDYSVYVRNINKGKTREVEVEEKTIWKRQIDQHEKEQEDAGSLDLW